MTINFDYLYELAYFTHRRTCENWRTSFYDKHFSWVNVSTEILCTMWIIIWVSTTNQSTIVCIVNYGNEYEQPYRRYILLRYRDYFSSKRIYILTSCHKIAQLKVSNMVKINVPNTYVSKLSADCRCYIYETKIVGTYLSNLASNKLKSQLWHRELPIFLLNVTYLNTISS